MAVSYTHLDVYKRQGQREGQIRAHASLVQDGIITVETGAEKAGMSEMCIRDRFYFYA